MAHPPRPRDFNQRAKLIIELATGEKTEKDPNVGKNPHAVALSKLGASKGGTARAEKLSAKKRKEIAKKAAKKRWEK